MIQDIFPHIYHNEYTPRQARPEDYLIAITEKGVLAAQNEDGTICLPRCGEKQGQYLFCVDDTGYFLWEGESLLQYVPVSITMLASVLPRSATAVEPTSPSLNTKILSVRVEDSPLFSLFVSLP